MGKPPPTGPGPDPGSPGCPKGGEAGLGKAPGGRNGELLLLFPNAGLNPGPETGGPPKGGKGEAGC